jgi:branched-chain amino acid transport system permease protein
MSSGIIAKSNAFVIGGIIVLGFVLLPQVANLGNYILSLLFTLFIYIILAQSWNLLGGYAGQFNLGLAAYFGTGVLSWSLLYFAGVPPYVAMLAGGVAAVILACIIGIPTLRLKGIYFAIGTLALAEALRITVGNFFPASVYVPPTYWSNYSIIERYYVGLVLVILTITTVYTMVNSKVGLALKAIRDDEDAAKATGVNPAKYKIFVFVISSFLVGLAGGAFSYYRGLITPVYQFLPDWTFGPLVAACIGGLGTITGPILGSIIFVLLQEFFSQTIGKAHFIVTGIFFILVILFLPRGLVQSGASIRRLLGRKP